VPHATNDTEICARNVRRHIASGFHRNHGVLITLNHHSWNHGIVVSDPIGALAHLQLARAYAREGDISKAKASYQNFLELWKNADPDIPVLRQAGAEYAKLR
jgi:hypothetical protein